MNMEQQLAACEKKIIALRQELSSISFSSAIDQGSELQKDKLNFLTIELKHLSTQVELLKKQANTVSTQDTLMDFSMKIAEDSADQPLSSIDYSTNKNEAAVSPQMNQCAKSTPVPPNSRISSNAASAPKPRYVRLDQHAVPQKEPQRNHVPRASINPMADKSPKTKDFESIFGKSWMAIFASVLIFISLVMLSAVVLPFLTDYIKVGIMFTFSIGLTVISYVLLRKNKDSKFLTALLGCGMGAIFISLLVTYISFHMFNQFVLYGLIVLWCIGAIFLSKFNSILFEIIGQLGISIALVLGLSCCNTADTLYLVPMLCGFYVITTYAFYHVNHKKAGLEGSISSIFILFDAFVILIGEFFITFFFEKDLQLENTKFLLLIAIGLCSTYLLLYLLLEYLIAKKKDIVRTLPAYICSLCVLVNNELLMHNLLFSKGERQYFSLLYLIIPGILVLMQLRPLGKETTKWIKITSLASLGLLSYALTDSILVFSILALICIVTTYFTEDHIYNIFSLIFAILFSIQAMSSRNADLIYLSVVVLLLLISCHFLLAGRVESSMNKIGAILMLYIFVGLLFLRLPEITEVLEASTCTGCIFIISSIITLLLLFTPVTADWTTGEKNTLEYKLVCIIQIILMVFGIAALNAVEDMSLKIATILVAVLLYAVRPEKTDTYKKVWDVFFVVRLTVLLMVILNVLHATNILFSIPMLIEAICFIVLGHIFGKKLYRVYGLVLSNICIAKLILIDISYEEAIQRALGFFICGVLCFLISFIYTRVEKIAMKKE